MLNLVPDDTDDGVRLEHSSVFAAQTDLSAKQVLVGKISAREAFVDNNDKGRGGCFRFGNHAAAHDRSTHHMRVAAANRGDPSIIAMLLVFGDSDEL